MRIFPAAILAIALSATVIAQAPSDPPKALHIGDGVSAPRLIHKVEPQYSPLARADRVQGSVVFQIIVDEHGLPRDIQVISPLGFGLDEKAEEAIAKWRFAPGMKEEKPVPVMARIEVNFRFPQIWFDASAEQRRTSFNVALKTLDETNAAAKDRAVKTVQDLAVQKFPAAMYLAGRWEMNGDNNVVKDTIEGWNLIQKAADRNYGPALFEVAMQSLQAGGDPAEMEKHLQTMRDSAVLGSIQAQFYLGQAYELGAGVPKEPDRARRYFRLCASKGEPLCQYRLGRLLLVKPGRTEDDYVQALAWLQLAADRKVAEAGAELDREQPQLSAEQAALVSTWKQQLTHNMLPNP
jgi:TonB family protein